MKDFSTAYDGMSKKRQRRALQPLERDVLCRILGDILHELREVKSLDALIFISGERGIRMAPEEIPMLVGIIDVIDPRRE